MHICIVGTGASGWIAAHFLKNNTKIKKITIIGSDKIPTIGVGEATTHSFREFLLNRCNLTEEEYTKFLIDSDASFKYGVSYEGWSKKKFLHPFAVGQHLGYLLGKKDPDDNYHKYVSPIHNEIYNNKVYFGTDKHEYSFHFDANKFISAMTELAKLDDKITHIVDTVIESQYDDLNNVSCIITDSKKKITADYFVSCIGSQAFNKTIFNEEYVSYSDILLTNKAVACPLAYSDRATQSHPYTVAKAMPNGWRWITPTLSRVGTGYVFSDNHISVDEATSQLLDDIGDRELIIDPFVVDFTPRRVKEVFKSNIATIGMAAGFLEPLDAPGLALTLRFLTFLEDILDNIESDNIQKIKTTLNQEAVIDYDFFCSFILHQYKTCKHSDTKFWIDQKNVQFDPYDEILHQVFDPVITKANTPVYPQSVREPWMFYNSTAGKDIRWEVKIDEDLTDITETKFNENLLFNHKELLDKMVKQSLK